MFPQLQSVLLGWTTPVQLRIVNKTPADFEVFENPIDVVVFDAMMVPMPDQKVNRKPEGLRIWKWWEVWTTTKIELDSVVQDEEGLQFRVQSRSDWGAAGFYHYDFTEQPK